MYSTSRFAAIDEAFLMRYFIQPIVSGKSRGSLPSRHCARLRYAVVEELLTGSVSGGKTPP
jgi:hypothetical protein